MKGNQLTLEQCMNLKDGTKVYIEDMRNLYTSSMCIKQDKTFINKKSPIWIIDNNQDDDWLRIKVYEWIEDIQKTEDTNDIYSHTYKGWELLKLYDEEKINGTTVIKYIHKNTTDTKTLEELLSHPHTLYRLTNSGSFKIIKPNIDSKPVTFLEVLNSDKSVRIEHELIDNSLEVFRRYNNLDQILFQLSGDFESNELRKILTEAKWYLKQ